MPTSRHTNSRDMRKPKVFVASTCECCGQTKDYHTSIDKGMVAIMQAFSVAVRMKGVNVLHPLKEMNANPGMTILEAVRMGKLTRTMSGNTSRARSHGLLARIRGRSGNWCITRKGFAFLRGEPVDKYAIIDKLTGDTIGHIPGYVVTIHDITKDRSAVYWDETILEGRVYDESEI